MDEGEKFEKKKQGLRERRETQMIEEQEEQELINIRCKRESVRGTQRTMPQTDCGENEQHAFVFALTWLLVASVRTKCL